MSQTQKSPYRVLARKYRPQNFDQLIGQDALVRTLKNAIASGRIAQAYMLTGIRGTGKTTTARIIAKALNYTGPDGKSGPTTGPTDDCETCRAIAEDRHPDVLEMDAASNTGVDNIREIIDGVRYAPASARYKVYIIDEVHMLSKGAFNALLKTLEEPPPHVIFVFATTEIRKVPVTVLSRCQRFDLRRVEADVLAAHYKSICEKEAVTAEDEALALIARAADGSVRDGLSLLDQAIALSDGTVKAQQIRDMLGLADQTRVLDILEHALKGECAQALDLTAGLYKIGADPLVLLQDMLELTHLMTRLRAAPQSRSAASATAAETLSRLSSLSAQLSMPTLGRAWQILLKGINEVTTAPNPMAAAEMILIRLAYAADLPDPADLLKKLKNGDVVSVGGPPRAAAPVTPSRQLEPVSVRRVAGGEDIIVEQPQAQTVAAEKLQTLQDVVALLESRREMILAGQVYHTVHLVKMAPGHIELRPVSTAQPALAQDLRNFLIKATDRQWMVSISAAPGAPTLAEQAAATQRALTEEARQHPVVREVLVAFPDAKLEVRRKQ